MLIHLISATPPGRHQCPFQQTSRESERRNNSPGAKLLALMRRDTSPNSNSKPEVWERGSRESRANDKVTRHVTAPLTSTCFVIWPAGQLILL